MDASLDGDIWQIALLALYGLVAVLCVGETVAEHRRGSRAPDGWYYAGLVLCAFWPLLLAVLASLYLHDIARRRRC